MAIKMAQGSLAALDKGAGTLAVALAVMAIMLIGCSGGSGNGADQLPSDSPATIELIYDSLGGRQALAEMTSLSLRATGSTAVHSEGRIIGELITANIFETQLKYRPAGSRWRIDYQRDTRFPFAFPREFSHVIQESSGWTEGLEGIPVLLPPGDMAPNKAAAHSLMQQLLNPHALFRRVLDGELAARDADSTDLDGVKHRVVTLDDGVLPITAFFDERSGSLTRLRLVAHDTLFCDTSIDINYAGWTPVEGGFRFPTRVTIAGFGGVLHEETRSDIVFNTLLDDNVFELPPQATRTLDEDLASQGQKRLIFHHLVSAMGVPFSLPQAEIQEVELAPGVFLLLATHNTLVVDQQDRLVVIEAPLERDRSAAISAWAAEKLPGKPITHVIVTHHHLDHAAGLRHFVAEGATIVTANSAERFYREQVFDASCTVLPDALAESPRAPSFEVVPTEGSLNLEATGNPMVVYHLDTAHAKDMLVVYLPNQAILFNSDLYNPLPEELLGLGVQPFFLEADIRDLADGIDEYDLEPMLIVGGHGAAAPMDVFTADLEALGP